MAKRKKSRKALDDEREELFDDWNHRVTEADKAYKEWEKDYRCDDLEKYYLGHQVEDPSQEYVINLVFPAIEIKIPTYLYAYPAARITPRPGKSDDLGSKADETCRLMEDTAVTCMSSREVGWREAYRLALQESFYRFGVVEHGYSADVAENPNAGKPLLDPDSGDALEDDHGLLIVQPQKIPVQEQMWCQRIPASQFRFPAVSRNEIDKNDWVGYFEWMHPEDIKANKNWDNTDSTNVKVTGQVTKAYRSSTLMHDEDRQRRYGLVKVWKVWDLRGMVRYVWPDEGKDFFLFAKPFDINPFSILRFHPIMDSAYPLPPVYNWIPPQDELNESRNNMRIHRRRSKRRYLMLENAIQPDEQEKLQSGPDGTIVQVNRLDAIKPLEDAPLDNSVFASVPQSAQDFMRISSVGGEQQGVAESKTATQANIISQTGGIRDNFGRMTIGEWVSNGIYVLLQLLRSNSALPFMVLTNVDFTSPGAPAEMQRVAGLWSMIEAEDLGKFDFDVTVDAESLSPQNDQQRASEWNQVLSIFANPTLMMVMASSDVILRKTLGFYGVKSDRELQEIKRSMVMVIQMIQQQAQAAAAAKGTSGGSQPGAGGGPGPTPSNMALRAQLQAQAAGRGM